MYQVHLQQFTGPLHALLDLIESKKLEITRVSLSDVTADFIEHIRQIGDETESLLLADFLVVAAKLMLIKSKVLLPSLELSEEEEDEIHDLEMRLSIYREFKRAGEHIAKGWQEIGQMYSRPLFFDVAGTGAFYPSSKLTKEDLETSLKKLLQVLREFIKEPETVKIVVISIEEKIKEIIDRLKEKSGHTFQNLAKNQPRTEIVAIFLAVLHLLKERFVHVEQKGQFGDILLKKK